MAVRTNVVIITYNAIEYTKATITSLYEKTHNEYNLTVVDNGSQKETVDYLDSLKTDKNCRKVTIIKNGFNAGVGHAYNQGQQVSFEQGVEFTAFCNNDLYFSNDWLFKLETRMSVHRNVAMLSPLRPSAKVRYNNSISTRDRLALLPELDSWQMELELYTNRPKEHFDDFAEQIALSNRNGRLERIAFPDSLSTCVCLTRNSMFKSFNYFADPIFTGYGGEDIDMSWTIMKHGFDCAVDHGVYVHHFRGKSLKSNNMQRQELLKKSNKVLYEKWKDAIEDFIFEKRLQGIDIAAHINDGQNSEYWLLYELNNTEKFLKDTMYAP